jgi:hypothetical protein
LPIVPALFPTFFPMFLHPKQGKPVTALHTTEVNPHARMLT